MGNPTKAHCTRLTIGSLFSGIGGLELGLERAGLGPVIWQVESDSFCRAVLAKHWPDAERYEDVREVGDELAPVGVICGGFPCQDISNSGKRAGLAGERSGLWSEFARCIRLLRPTFVVVENVAALVDRGLGVVLGDLAAAGYDAEWDCISATELGAPHGRDRVWVLAYSDEHRPQDERVGSLRDHIDASSRAHADRCGAARAWPPPQGAMRLWAELPPEAQPAICRGASGYAAGLEQLRALGNVAMPVGAEVVGRRLMELANG